MPVDAQLGLNLLTVNLILNSLTIVFVAVQPILLSVLLRGMVASTTRQERTQDSILRELGELNRNLNELKLVLTLSTSQLAALQKRP